VSHQPTHPTVSPSTLPQLSDLTTSIPGVAITSMNATVAPGMLSATAAGSVGNAPVDLEVSSVAVPDNSSQRVSSFKIFSRAKEAMAALLASQASLINGEVGTTISTNASVLAPPPVPPPSQAAPLPPPPESLPPSSGTPAGSPPAGGGQDGGGSSSPSAAEFIFDSLNGLRMFNISLPTFGKIGMPNLADIVGFPWQSGGGGSGGGGSSSSTQSEMVLIDRPSVVFAPRKPGAPGLSWFGKDFNMGELLVSAQVDIPLWGISGAGASIKIDLGGKLSLEVRAG
jgi:hypothetical protein